MWFFSAIKWFFCFSFIFPLHRNYLLRKFKSILRNTSIFKATVLLITIVFVSQLSTSINSILSSPIFSIYLNFYIFPSNPNNMHFDERHINGHVPFKCSHRKPNFAQATWLEGNQIRCSRYWAVVLFLLSPYWQKKEFVRKCSSLVWRRTLDFANILFIYILFLRKCDAMEFFIGCRVIRVNVFFSAQSR